MAVLIRANGTREAIAPENGAYFSLAELQKAVGGYIEICQSVVHGQLIVCDEEGKCKDKPINSRATMLYYNGFRDPIAGDVLLGTEEEINGPNADIDDNGNMAGRTVDEQKDTD